MMIARKPCWLRLSHVMPAAVRILVAAMIVAGASAASAQKAKTPTEQLVLKQLEETSAADLSPTSIRDKAVHHDFLEDVLTSTHLGKATAIRAITIAGATVVGQVNLNNISVPFSVTFKNCVFPDGMDFSGAKFARDFRMVSGKVGTPPDDAGSAASSAIFNGMKVKGQTSFSDLTFNSDVDFTQAEFRGGLKIVGVTFVSPPVADFDSVKAEGPISFTYSHFAGELYLSNAVLSCNDPTLLCLDIEDASSENASGLTLQINQAHINHNLAIKNSPLASLEVASSVVEGTGDFEKIALNGDVDFKLSQFGSLYIMDFSGWLKGCPSAFFLAEPSFDAITVDKASIGSPLAAQMLDQLHQCPYRQQPYLDLEKFLSSYGSPADADEVYIQMRRRAHFRLSWFLRFLDGAQDFLVGYGRKTWKAALYVLLVILVGTFIFRRDTMDSEDPATRDDWYNPFWYSLDLLSPVDLGFAPKWRAKHHWMRSYALAQRIVGWILVPLIAAAIAGIIR